MWFSSFPSLLKLLFLPPVPAIVAPAHLHLAAFEGVHPRFGNGIGVAFGADHWKSLPVGVVMYHHSAVDPVIIPPINNNRESLIMKPVIRDATHQDTNHQNQLLNFRIFKLPSLFF
jgi:hypothetical protein